MDKYNIAGYCRISVDSELDKDNVSIENQKSIIRSYVHQNFPGSQLTFFEDRDRSGYTFTQREAYQKMRTGLISHEYEVLIIKDFSRFSRRNSKGLVELEDLRDAGVRIISITDNVDFPNDNDWLKISIQFLMNEIPVTDTSKKIRHVIKNRQENGDWICAAPYGYIINKQRKFVVVPEEAEVVKKVFDLYNAGWGYKRISNYLTDEKIPTPRMAQKMRKEAEGEECKLKARAEWSIVSVQGILDNDFYVGTFREGKYTRRNINGKDVKVEDKDHIVIEDHHDAIIDARTFAITRSQREKRTRNNYRGIKKYDNMYSGFLRCGDCGSPMFPLSRKDLSPAYTCGAYHRRGLKGCTSHHIRVDTLDEVVKLFVQNVMKNSQAMLVQLGKDLAEEKENFEKAELSVDKLIAMQADLRQELKETERQRIRQLMKSPEKEDAINEQFDEMVADIQDKLQGLTKQIDMLADKRNTIIKVNRTASTVMEVFQEILSKEHLDRNDLEIIIDKIVVYEDHVDVKLHPDITALLECGPQEDAVNFNSGIGNIEKYRLIQTAMHQLDKVFNVHVISDGDPLEIYTEKDGGVIFRKYSPMGDLQEFASQMCESIGSATGCIAAVSDRDSIIALSGAPKRELMDKPNSPELEKLMEQRKNYLFRSGDTPIFAADGAEKYPLGAAAPIVSQGDLMGCVMLLLKEGDTPLQEPYQGLAKTAAGFLGMQMES